MMNKTMLISAAGLLTTAAVFAGYQMLSQSRLLQEQLGSYEEYVSQLQSELESFGEQQVRYETELNTLRRELASSETRINALEDELGEARSQIDPDVQQLEQQIRERVIVEMQQSSQDSLSRVDLVKELNNLQPEELGEMMTLQSMYGGFLNELDVDDQRMEVLIDGFSNIIAEQNQARMDAIEELRSNPEQRNPAAVRERMLAIDSPQARLDALSYLLTDEEMEIYQEYREQQLQSGTLQTQTFAIRQGSRLADRAEFIDGTSEIIIQDGQGDAPAIHIIETEIPPQ